MLQNSHQQGLDLQPIASAGLGGTWGSPFGVTNFYGTGAFYRGLPRREDYDNPAQWRIASIIYYANIGWVKNSRRIEMAMQSRQLYMEYDKTEKPRYAFTGKGNKPVSRFEFTTFNPIKKYIDERTGEIASQVLKVKARITNREAKSRQDEYYKSLMAHVVLSERMPEIAQYQSEKGLMPDPQTLLAAVKEAGSVRNYADKTWKDIYQDEAQTLIEDWIQQSRYEDLRPQLKKELLLTNMLVCMPRINPYTLNVELNPQMMNPYAGNFYLLDLDAKGDFLEDAAYIVNLRYMSPPEILTQYPGVDEKALLTYSTSYRGYAGTSPFGWLPLHNAPTNRFLVAEGRFKYIDEVSLESEEPTDGRTEEGDILYERIKKTRSKKDYIEVNIEGKEFEVTPEGEILREFVAPPHPPGENEQNPLGDRKIKKSGNYIVPEYVAERFKDMLPETRKDFLHNYLSQGKISRKVRIEQVYTSTLMFRPVKDTESKQYDAEQEKTYWGFYEIQGGVLPNQLRNADVMSKANLGVVALAIGNSVSPFYPTPLVRIKGLVAMLQMFIWKMNDLIVKMKGTILVVDETIAPRTADNAGQEFLSLIEKVMNDGLVTANAGNFASLQSGIRKVMDSIGTIQIGLPQGMDILMTIINQTLGWINDELGFSPAKQGNSPKYETAQGVKNNITQSDMITADEDIKFFKAEERIFDMVANYQKMALVMKQARNEDIGKSKTAQRALEIRFGDTLKTVMVSDFLFQEIGITLTHRTNDQRLMDTIWEITQQSAVAGQMDAETVDLLINVLDSFTPEEARDRVDEALNRRKQEQMAQMQAEQEHQKAMQAEQLQHEKEIQDSLLDKKASNDMALNQQKLDGNLRNSQANSALQAEIANAHNDHSAEQARIDRAHEAALAVTNLENQPPHQ